MKPLWPGMCQGKIISQDPPTLTEEDCKRRVRLVASALQSGVVPALDGAIVSAVRTKRELAESFD